jgi:hypothetical protein
MANDIYTTTPGSAVADVVQQILQRRKDEARQMMVDRLGIEKFRADEDQRGVTNAMNERQEGRMGRMTDAQIAAANANREKDILSTLPHGATEIGGFSPEIQKLLRDRALARMVPGQPPVEEPAPTGSAVEVAIDGRPQGKFPITPTMQTPDGEAPVFRSKTTAPPPDSEMYIGSSDFQKAGDERNRMLGTVTPELEKDNPLFAQLIRMQAAGVNAPVPGSVSGPKPSVTPIRPNGTAANRVEGERGTEFMELNPPAASSVPSYQYVGTDKDGNPLFASNRVGADGRPNLVSVPVPGGGGIQPKPTPAISGIVPAGVTNSWRAGLPRRNGEGEDAYNSRQAQVRNSIVASLGPSVSPRAKNFISQALGVYSTALASGQPAPNILKTAETVQPPFSPEELGVIQQFMTAFTTPQAE